MPTTNRGYPYETPADEPGWSVTGGSDGDMLILAQVIDADVTSLANTVTGNAGAAAAALAAHEADTTAVHGIANTANLVVTTDPRLSDARAPTAHAASHETGGGDPVAAGSLDGYGEFAGKNGALAVQVCGRTEVPGAPAAGTWAAGDLIIDSVGVWHLCTADGTPGTWT
jgi:hypothetical protein